MDSGVLRDFVIVITGCLFLIMLLLVGLTGFLIYRQIKTLTRLVKDTINTAKETGTEIKESIKSTKDLINIFKKESPKSENKPPAGAAV